jgi:hypothetical protein
MLYRVPRVSPGATACSTCMCMHIKHTCITSIYICQTLPLSRQSLGQSLAFFLRHSFAAHFSPSHLSSAVPACCYPHFACASAEAPRATMKAYYALRDRVGLNVKIKRLRVLFACIVYKNLQISLMASAYRNKHAFNVYRSCTRMRTATTASNLPPFDECRLSSCLPQKACQAIPTLVLLYGELGRGKSRQTTKKIKQGVMS